MFEWIKNKLGIGKGSKDEQIKNQLALIVEAVNKICELIDGK